jgi:hypothetical protein
MKNLKIFYIKEIFFQRYSYYYVYSYIKLIFESNTLKRFYKSTLDFVSIFQVINSITVIYFSPILINISHNFHTFIWFNFITCF